MMHTLYIHVHVHVCIALIHVHVTSHMPIDTKRDRTNKYYLYSSHKCRKTAVGQSSCSWTIGIRSVT